MTVAETTDAAEAPALRCPKCGLALETAAFASGAPVDCPACRSQLSAVFYPAFLNPPEPVSTSSGERALDGEAACFFHAAKRATLSCDQCGRFLCQLCDMPLGSRHLCPVCLGASRTGDLVRHRAKWQNVALLLGVAPFFAGWIVWPSIFISGPAAVIVALWSWNKPGSLVKGQRHWAGVIGIAGGLLQIAAIVALIVFVWQFIPRFQ